MNISHLVSRLEDVKRENYELQLAEQMKMDEIHRYTTTDMFGFSLKRIEHIYNKIDLLKIYRYKIPFARPTSKKNKSKEEETPASVLNEFAQIER